MDQFSIQKLIELPAILDSIKLVKLILQMSLHRGGGWGGGVWDSALNFFRPT